MQAACRKLCSSTIKMLAATGITPHCSQACKLSDSTRWLDGLQGRASITGQCWVSGLPLCSGRRCLKVTNSRQAFNSKCHLNIVYEPNNHCSLSTFFARHCVLAWCTYLCLNMCNNMCSILDTVHSEQRYKEKMGLNRCNTLMDVSGVEGSVLAIACL